MIKVSAERSLLRRMALVKTAGPVPGPGIGTVLAGVNSAAEAVPGMLRSDAVQRIREKSKTRPPYTRGVTGLWNRELPGVPATDTQLTLGQPWAPGQTNYAAALRYANAKRPVPQYTPWQRFRRGMDAALGLRGTRYAYKTPGEQANEAWARHASSL